MESVVDNVTVATGHCRDGEEERPIIGMGIPGHHGSRWCEECHNPITMVCKDNRIGKSTMYVWPEPSVCASRDGTYWIS